MRLTEEWIEKSKVLVSVKDLSYLIKGGRLSYTKGLIARILNVNPIVSIDKTGKAIVFDKTLNQRATMEKVMSYVRKQVKETKIWNYVVLHANNQQAADWYSERMEELTSLKPVSVVNISPVIGANVGVGAAAVAYMIQ